MARIHDVITDHVVLQDDNVAASSKTFTNGFSHNIPSPEDSIVCVLGTWTATNANADPTSCTVGGVSLTISGRFINNSSGANGIGVLAFDIAASGDMTGDVVINFDDDVDDLGLEVFSIASDGTTNFNVNGNSDGASPWDGVNFGTANADVATISICAAVASETTDVTPVTAGAEVLTGATAGVVTGTIEWNCAAIRQTATDHDVQFDGDTATGSAMLAYFSYGGLTDIPRTVDADHDGFLATQDAALTVSSARTVAADHDAFLATQSADLDVVAKATASQDGFLATQSAAAKTIAKTTAAHDGFLATQSAAAKAIIDVTAAHDGFLATQSADLGVQAGIVAGHVAFLASQDADLVVKLKTTAAHDGFLAAQSVSAKLIAKATADHDAFLATQDADVITQSGIVADHDAFLATQSAASKVILKTTAGQTAFLAANTAPLKVLNEVSSAQDAFLAAQDAALAVTAAGITADHDAFLAAQSAALKVLDKATAAQDGFLATQSASLGVRNDVLAAHIAFLATQSLSIAVGERETIGLTGSNPNPVALTGQRTTPSLTGSVPT